MKTFFELQDQDWRVVVDSPEDAIAEIMRPDKERRGAWIGPLATVSMGMTEEDDDGEEVLLLNGASGRDLYAIAALPQIAGMVAWALAELGSLNGIHFDSTTEAGRFHLQLKERLNWIKDMVDERPESICEGTHAMQRWEDARKK